MCLHPAQVKPLGSGVASGAEWEWGKDRNQDGREWNWRSAESSALCQAAKTKHESLKSVLEK